MKILMTLIFYPRGGSAQVARYLSRALIELGHDVHLITGTLRDGDPHHDAEHFFQGIPLTLVDYTDAWAGFKNGQNPLAEGWEVPFHPSYEDKPDVPDRVFYKVTDAEYQGLLRSWKKAFEEVKDHFQPDILHLNHLTHAHVAAARVFPGVPRITQLHGTEIKMLERMDELKDEPDGSPEWDHVGRNMLDEGIRVSHHFAAISPDIRDRGIGRLGISGDRITTIPNGVDTSLFKPSGWSPAEKWNFLKKILVDAPQGWDESGVPGSVSYTEEELERFRDSSGNLKPMAIFVGRFLDFKRVPMLLQAVARANEGPAGTAIGEADPPFNLLVWGGMPGEWEGDHPVTVARDLGLSNVFFCGWLSHDVLSRGLELADVLVAPSYNEPFGQVFIEAMATGMPVIATRSGGPLGFVVESGPEANGWLCEVDDVGSLAGTLQGALSDGTELQRRGKNALRLIRESYDWKEIARRYLEAYQGLSS